MGGLILGLRRQILDLRGLSFGPENADFGPERANFGLERVDLGPERGLRGGTDGRMDRRMCGCMEIHPCVLQDIGPLGPLPKKEGKDKKGNKAGYTATSCGRVGRGVNARFPTFQRTDGRTDGRTDKTSYRVACPLLKRSFIPLVSSSNCLSFS